MRRYMTILSATAALGIALLATAIPAAACAGLIGSNGAVNLGRTTTLAAYHDVVEHYVTAFKFQGGGWTLQRLQQETAPPRLLSRGVAAFAAADSVEVVLQTRVDALDLTVLKGGSQGVAAWATDHGFRLSPDAPEILEFYAAAARGQEIGDGTPVQITIPTSNPWVPLRILGLGKQPGDRIEADVFLLTDLRPSFLPQPRPGMALAHNAAATSRLLDDLRSDERMEWVPTSAWLTKLGINSGASDLAYDLAIDATGNGAPSRVAAGLDPVETPQPMNAVGLVAGLAIVLLGGELAFRRFGFRG